MSARIRFYRHREIQRVRSDLEYGGFPRLQMLLLVALTGAAGFVTSYGFLRAGLTEMWIRYLVSFGFAYLVFLFLLWLWLRTRAEDYADFPDVSGGVPSSSGSGSSDIFSGQGGNFGGGGASGSFAGPIDHAPLVGDTGSIGEALGNAAEAEEFAIPLVVLILIAALLLSSFFVIYSVIYSAPAFFAELVVDGVLSASLYRRLRGLDTPHWLETALRRTAWPFALTAAIVSFTGWAMAQYAPEAHSVGDVIFYSKQVKSGANG
ncbi:MAG TPA: hypothetical protein VFK88_07105 [Gallionella sp.]|nr:hypothetical protein [Gallionella sp.]